MASNETLAQAVELANAAVGKASPQAPWRERANAELEKIVALFSSKELPDLCAKALINAPEKPSSKWSMGNQLLMLLAGTTDARGFRQWNEAGRWVARDKKAIWILGPVRKKVRQEPLEGGNQPEEVKEVLIGFKAIPVFRHEDTCGQELPVYQPRNPPPLMEVAERFGMRVQYARLGPGMYGATDHTTKTIVLASEDCDVFFHELGHAIHRTFEPKTGHGQEAEAETVAQLVAATLARLYGRPADSFSWSYISMYAPIQQPPECRKALHARSRQNKESPRPNLPLQLNPLRIQFVSPSLFFGPFSWSILVVLSRATTKEPHPFMQRVTRLPGRQEQGFLELSSSRLSERSETAEEL